MKNKKLNLIDIVTLIYITWVLGIIIIFNKKIEHFYFYLAGYICYILLIIFIHKLYLRMPEKKLVILLKYCYPIIFLEFLYKAIEKYVTIFYGGFLDDIIINIESIFFNINPALYLERFITPLLTEIMKFSYLIYYFYMPFLILALFFMKRYGDMVYSVFIMSLTFYACYIGFVLFPVEGPRFSFDFHVPVLKGYFFSHIQESIMKYGQSIGACMPSSHIAAAWNVVFLVKKFLGKRLFYLLFVLTILMSVSIVYNRYHYFSDGVAGIITAYISYQAGKMFFRKWGRCSI